MYFNDTHLNLVESKLPYSHQADLPRDILAALPGALFSVKNDCHDVVEVCGEIQGPGGML